MNHNEQNNFDFLDILEILAFIIQVLDYEATLSQVGNDDILRELRADMAEIRQQNNEIKCMIAETVKNKS